MPSWKKINLCLSLDFHTTTELTEMLFIYFFVNFISICMYKANKGVVVVVVVNLYPYLTKRQNNTY